MNVLNMNFPYLTRTLSYHVHSFSDIVIETQLSFNTGSIDVFGLRVIKSYKQLKTAIFQIIRELNFIQPDNLIMSIRVSIYYEWVFFFFCFVFERKKCPGVVRVQPIVVSFHSDKKWKDKEENKQKQNRLKCQCKFKL